MDGQPGDKETPLITAASYGDAEVTKVLVAGADANTRSASDSGVCLAQARCCTRPCLG